MGALLHLPDYLMAEPPDYMMVGMDSSPAMWVGMTMIFVGLALAAWRLWRARGSSTPASESGERIESTGLTRAHRFLLAFATLALVIDVMKPATIGFVLPGMREEYGISQVEVGYLGLVALSGTVLGSFAWGALADRVGRRSSLMLAALLFMATSVCGAMPSYGANLITCFVMGAAAGGFLPVVLTLVTESMPKGSRGFAVVLVGGLGSAGGYLAASAAAALLEPVAGWRALWLLGFPTSVLLVAVAALVPESPRFLRLNGRNHEAARVMARLRMRVTAALPAQDPGDNAGAPGLTRKPSRGLTTGLALASVTSGIVSLGFLTWAPTLFERIPDLDVKGLLASSAIFALPATALVALLYSRWSARKTLIASFALAALALGGIIAGSSGGWGLQASIVILLIAANALNAVILPYSAEIYPTLTRGRGTGAIAASAKLGGLVGIQLLSVVIALTSGPTIAVITVLVPLALASLFLAAFTVETRGAELAEQP